MENKNDFVSMWFVIAISAITIFIGLFLAGCATVKPEMKDNNLQMPVSAELAPKVAGVDNSKNEHTNQTVGRDMTTTNDSKMISELWEANTKVTEKLISSYKFIINVLIIQLCGLVAMFIRKDEKATTQLIKFISEDEEREDGKANS